MTAYDVRVRMRVTQAAAAVACLLLSMVLFSCGSEEPGSPSMTRPAPAEESAAASALTAYLVTEADVETTPEGSPQRAFLTWWQAMQYGNFERAYGLLAPAVRQEVPLRRFSRDGRLAAAGFAARPQLVQAQPDGSRVDVLVNLFGYNNGKPSVLQPQAFRFEKVGDEWLLANLEYLQNRAEVARDAGS